jgi:hypothetical protein
VSRTPEGWTRRVYWEDTNGDRLTLAALVYAGDGTLVVVRRTDGLTRIADYAQWDTDRLRDVLDNFTEYIASADLFHVHTYGFPKPSPIQLGRPEPIYSSGGAAAARLFPNTVEADITTSKRDGTTAREDADIEWICGPMEPEWEDGGHAD